MDIMVILSLSIVIVLGIIIHQDLCYRTLDAKYGLTLLLLCCIYNYKNPLINFKEMLYILAFIAINIAVLFLYFSIKKKRVFNPVDTKIGLGDIVFFLAVTPLFLLKDYILFFVSGLLFSIALSLGVNVITKNENSIPLAGYLAIYLVGVFAINFLFNKSFLNLGSV